MGIDVGTIFSEVRITLDKLKGDIRRVETHLDQFANKNKQRSTQVKNSWKQSFKEINLSGVVAFAAIGIAVKQAIDVFAKYEQAMANVQSVTDATAEDFKKLEEAAIEAGESTRFTATQAADALYFLASAGLSAEQSISALQGVLQLAGATGSDLASTSATMAATLSQFSLNAEESTRVSNVFSAAISNSQANMEKLAGALKQVGPISGALDISLEETVASLEALFNAGFAGEQAGTGLRNILLDLSDSSGPVIRQLEALGVAFDKVNPREVGLTNAIDELAKSGVDLGTIFGKRVAAQMLTLAKTGGNALRELETEITNTNSAAEMYAIQNDTLAGSIDFLKSAMESMAIKISEEINPAFRGIVDAITDAVKWFNSLPGPIKLAFGIFSAGTPIIAGLAIAIQTLGAALAGIGGPILLAVGAIAALVGIIASINQAMVDYENRFVDAADATKEQREQTEKLLEEYDTLKQESKDNAEAQRRLKEVIKELAGILPNAAVQFNEYGEAIDIAREKAEEFTGLQLQNEIQLRTAEVDRRRQNLNTLAAQIREAKSLIDLKQDEVDKANELLATTTDQGFIQVLETQKNQAIAMINLTQQRLIGEGKLLEQQQEQVDTIAMLREGLEQLAIQADPERRKAEEERLQGIEDEIKANEELAANQDRLAREQEQRDRDSVERQKEVAELREEFRREQLSKQEQDEEDLRTRRDEFISAGIDAEEWYQSQLAAIREKYAEGVDDSGEDEEAAATKRLLAVKEQYRQKLEDIGKTQIELLELQKDRAIDEIKLSEATEAAKKASIAALEEYYAKLIDNTANAQFKENFMEMVNVVLSGFGGLFSALSQLSAALTENRIADLDAWLQAELEASGLVEETTVERLRRELEEAKIAGDAETAVKLEDDLQRAQIESDYQKQLAIIKYEGELKQWRYTLAIGIASAASAILSGYASKPFIPVGLGAGILASIKSGIQVGAIKAAKPKPPGAQTGGIVLPSGGGTELTVAENQAPELLLNGGAEGEAFLNSFAQRVSDIVNAGNGNKIIQVHLYMDGKKVAESSANYYNKGIVRIDL